MRFSPFSLLLLLIIGAYRLFLSPLLPVACRFAPSCSDYARHAVKTHGAWRGTWLALLRIGRCHPWGKSGYDPVPACLKDHTHE